MAMKSMILIIVLVVVLVATQAKAAYIGVININGNVSCSVNASVVVNGTTPTLPPFPNALVQLTCNGKVIASDITNVDGALSITVSPSIISLNTVTSSCKVVVVTPLSTCNATLPSTQGALQAPLQFVGNTIYGILNLFNVVTGAFVSVSA